MTSATKSPYEVLELDPASSMEEIKSRFRQQIALYHPDKVQHLGREIQEVATSRASELTEAYRVLCTQAGRSALDAQLRKQEACERKVEVPPPASPGFAGGPHEEGRNAPAHGGGEIEVGEFMRKAALNRLHGAVGRHVPCAESRTLTGFDATFVSRPKWSIFRPQPPLCVLGRLVDKVDGEAVKEAWRNVLRTGSLPSGDTYLFLMGCPMENARSLSRVILESRRKSATRAGAQLLMVPLNISTWEVLTPCEAPTLLRSIIGTLKSPS